MKHITLYEEQHKKQFKILGEPVTDIISKQWALRKENKEQEKKAKVRNSELLTLRHMYQGFDE